MKSLLYQSVITLKEAKALPGRLMEKPALFYWCHIKDLDKKPYWCVCGKRSDEMAMGENNKVREVKWAYWMSVDESYPAHMKLRERNANEPE